MTIIALLVVVALLAGGVASVVGFGIGSLLTPALAPETGIKLAVAAISIPHAIGTAIRLSTLRAHVNREVLLRFGIASAIGGLMGALLHAWAGGAVLSAVFGLLLLSAGLAELAGWAKRVRLQGAPAIAAGGASGLLGGMVGNQGGIRSAALLGFNLPRDSFIATATAIALIVDAARMPVYLCTEGRQLLETWPTIAWITAGVVIGTLLGRRFLARIPETVFRRIVGVFVLFLGIYMLYRAAALAIGH
jgi:uncharacterized membrane protein YfcA